MEKRPTVKMHTMLKFHRKSCFTCKYYRVYLGYHHDFSQCLRIGSILSPIGDTLHDRARYCSLWRKRPKDWDPYTDKNPYFFDKYIPREELELLWKNQL